MRACTLASGSSGNAIFVEEGETRLLVDAGLTGKDILSKLENIMVEPASLDGILVTHEHTDHIKGVGVLSRKLNLKVYASEATWAEMEDKIGPVPDSSRCIVEKDTALQIGALKIEPFATSHDAVDSQGYCFFGREHKVGIATDTGILTPSARKYIDDADLFIFEANHDLNMLKQGRYPWPLKKRILSDRGHLSNVAAGHCLRSLIGGQTKGVILAHLSRENNLPDLAFSTVSKILAEFGLDPGNDFELDVAPRSEPGRLWELDE